MSNTEIFNIQSFPRNYLCKQTHKVREKTHEHNTDTAQHRKEQNIFSFST